MIKIAIVDDEKHSIESLSIHLKESLPNAEIEFSSNKAQEALEYLKSSEIDLLFLDIEMPNMNGFQLLEHLSNREFDVIFITAYNQYAIQAFKTKAISYLLKPIDEDELREVLDMWLKEKEKKDSLNNKNIDALVDHLKKEGFMKSKIAVPITDGYEFIEVDQIIYCRSSNNYTYIIQKDETVTLVCKTMKEVEAVLQQFFFLRIHQSYLVNPNYMKKFSRNQGGIIIMNNNDTIPVSKSKRDLVVNVFESIKRLMD